jgi:type II secretory pathway component GspD/PulD (secretin)
MRFVRLAFILLLACGAVRAEEVEVIALKYRTADQLIPTLSPLVEPGGGLSGMQSTLIIRSSRRNIEQLRQVIATLDRLPRKLLISVRQDAAATSGDRGARVSGTIGSGDVRVGVNEPPRAEGATVTLHDSRSARDERITSRVQALEGSPAYIAVGQEVPVQQSIITHSPTGSITQSTVQYRNISTGFYVTPRLAGERVFLDIATQAAAPAGYGPGSANVQQVQSSASGRLGEWFQLGGIDQSAMRSQSGILQGTRETRGSINSVWVKVEEIP